MNTKKNAGIAVFLTALLVYTPLAGFAQAATSFSGEGIALKATAPLGIALTVGDTGALPSSGGNLSTSALSVNVLGLVSADALKSTAAGSGTSSTATSQAVHLNLLGGVITADVVKSNSSATCSGTTASTSGDAQLVNLVVAGQSVAVSNPNLSLTLPAGLGSVVVNQQTSSSSGGNSGSITVNALHVTGPAGLDIIVASSMSDITC
jgi:hypothetical protein